jgi:hypothetical protein
MAPCSADARRAPGAVGVSRPWKTSAIAPALAIHGGLTPAALVNMRWSIAKIAFRRQTFAPQHRSGGRQPPCGSATVPAREISHTFTHDRRTATQERGASAPRGRHSTSELAARKFVALHLQTRFTNPRRAHARRSSLSVRRSRNHTRLLRYSVGVTSLGGLTPAALMHVRWCTADGALFSGRTSCTRSGRRKPTVENVRDCTGVSNPRRAHARRSWCAFDGSRT